MKVHRTLALVLALGAAGAPLVTAWAKEAVSITISGPGLAGAVHVTDEADFRILTDMGGAGISASTLPVLGDEFYVVRIGIGDETGQVFATFVHHYYSDPEGGPGYLKLFDMEGGESSEIGKWTRAAAVWDGAFRSVLQSHGVSLAAASSAQVTVLPAPAVEAPVAVPVASPALNPLTGLVLAAIVTGVITAIGAGRMRVALRAHEGKGVLHEGPG